MLLILNKCLTSRYVQAISLVHNFSLNLTRTVIQHWCHHTLAASNFVAITTCICTICFRLTMRRQFLWMLFLWEHLLKKLQTRSGRMLDSEQAMLYGSSILLIQWASKKWFAIEKSDEDEKGPNRETSVSSPCQRQAFLPIVFVSSAWFLYPVTCLKAHGSRSINWFYPFLVSYKITSQSQST